MNHLYIHSSPDMPNARVEMMGTEEAVATCVQLIEDAIGRVTPEPRRSDGGWPCSALPLREHQRFTSMFPFLQRRSCVRITPDKRAEQLLISGQTKGAVGARPNCHSCAFRPRIGGCAPRRQKVSEASASSMWAHCTCDSQMPR